jgi:hypothetical protein
MRHRNKFEPYRQSALGLASLRVPVMIKVIEACTQARRNFLQLHPAPARAVQLEIIDENGAPITTVEGAPSLSQQLRSDVSQQDTKHSGCFGGGNQTEDGAEKDYNRVVDKIEDEVEIMEIDKFDDADNVLGKKETESEEPENLIIKEEGEEEVMDEIEDYDQVMLKGDDVGGGMEDCKLGTEVIVKTEDQVGDIAPATPLQYPAGGSCQWFLQKLRTHVDTYLSFQERMESQAKTLEWTSVFGSMTDGSAESLERLKEDD